MKVSPHVRANVTADGVMFLDIASGQMFAANRVGARIWQQLESGSSEEQIVAELTREHGAVPAIAEDVRGFIAALEQRAFVQQEKRA